MVIIICVVSLEVNNANIMYATAASEESSSNDIFLSSSSILLDSWIEKAFPLLCIMLSFVKLYYRSDHKQEKSGQTSRNHGASLCCVADETKANGLSPGRCLLDVIEGWLHGEYLIRACSSAVQIRAYWKLTSSVPQPSAIQRFCRRYIESIRCKIILLGITYEIPRGNMTSLVKGLP